MIPRSNGQCFARNPNLDLASESLRPGVSDRPNRSKGRLIRLLYCKRGERQSGSTANFSRATAVLEAVSRHGILLERLLGGSDPLNAFRGIENPFSEDIRGFRQPAVLGADDVVREARFERAAKWVC